MSGGGPAAAPDGISPDGYAHRIVLPDATATSALGAVLAPHLESGDVVSLAGDLGAGKTTLARGLIGALGYDGAVPSPTFTLVQQYETTLFPVWHFDLYRISHLDEVIELGFDEARAEGIVLVEWADRLGAAMPSTGLTIDIDYDQAGRLARLTGSGIWAERLRDLRS